MADLIRLPGGHLYPDPADGPYVLSKDFVAVQRAEESLDMQLMERVGAAESVYAEAQAELDAVKAVAGLSASSPVDGQTALLLADDASLTGKALAAELEASRPGLAPRASGRAPRVVREVELLTDAGNGRTGDGAKFASVIYVGDKPGSWPDKWIGYVSGHNSPAIWLVSAPDLLGPWKWETAVVGTSSSSATWRTSAVTNHAASPSVVWADGRLVLLFHGPLSSNYLEQPTFAVWSSNGRAFAAMNDAKPVIPTEYADNASPYRTSTSYANVVWADGQLHALWQGTTGWDAQTSQGRYAPMPVGYGTSTTGRAWVKRDPVIYSPPGGQGLLAPGMSRVEGGWVVVGSLRTSDGAGGQAHSVGCYMGATLDDLHRVEDIVLPGTRTQHINSPQFFTHKGRSWMLGGVLRATGGASVISAFELDWSIQ